MTTVEQLRILRHMLGIPGEGIGPPSAYRDYFASCPEGAQLQQMTDLESRGLVRRADEPRPGRPYVIFTTTAKGRQLAEESYVDLAKTLTKSQLRYRKYLEVSDCFESFGHYLKHLTRRKHEA